MSRVSVISVSRNTYFYLTTRLNEKRDETCRYTQFKYAYTLRQTSRSSRRSRVIVSLVGRAWADAVNPPKLNRYEVIRSLPPPSCNIALPHGRAPATAAAAASSVMELGRVCGARKSPGTWPARPRSTVNHVDFLPAESRASVIYAT